ncbi:LysR family transcriptional regulator [Herbaspirillum sp. HC18]|nr:LysR family transcriptional regulator [Herbaspirillum sp. HC18]
MNVTLKQIRAFLAVAEHGTFSRAAFALHISQPALTRLVQELESSIELKLVERAPNGTRLTADGEDFRPLASQLVRGIEESLKDLRQRSKGIRGTVTVAVGTAFATAIMPALISHCRKMHPGIKVVIRDDNSVGIVQRVADGQADFGVGSLVGDLSKLVVEPLMKAPLGVIWSPNYFSLPSTISLSDLSGYSLIHHASDTSIWHILNRDPAGAALGNNAAVVATNLAAVIALAAEGVGIAVMSALGASGPLSEGLNFTPLSDEGMSRSIYLFSRNSAPLSRAASVVKELIFDPSFRAKLRDVISWDEKNTTPLHSQ